MTLQAPSIKWPSLEYSDSKFLSTQLLAILSLDFSLQKSIKNQKYPISVIIRKVHLSLNIPLQYLQSFTHVKNWEIYHTHTQCVCVTHTHLMIQTKAKYEFIRPIAVVLGTTLEQHLIERFLWRGLNKANFLTHGSSTSRRWTNISNIIWIALTTSQPWVD